MVKSTVVGITPTAHGASHLAGGTDPFLHAATHVHGGGDAVTGDVRINVAPVLQGVGAQVFNGVAPVAWTNLDLSADVGSNRALVLLMVRDLNAGVGAFACAFREDLRADEVYDGNTSGYGVSQGLVNENAGTRDSFFIVTTSAAGVVEWTYQGATNVQIYLVGYIV